MPSLTSQNGRFQGILGPDGNPWRSGPDQFALPHVAQFQSVLGSAWKTYWHDRWDEALRTSREDALAMKRDVFLMGLLQERKLATASAKWHLEVDDEDDPIQKALADGLTKVIQSTPRLQRMLMYLLEALWYGRYASQVIYEWKMLEVPALHGDGSTEYRRCLTIKKHQPLNGDKIGHQYDGTPYVLVNSNAANQLPNAETIITTQNSALLLNGTWRQRFLIHTHEVEDADFFEAERGEAIHGVGIRSVIYWINWLRTEWLSNTADWCERTGLGVRLWYYQGGNPASRDEIARAAKEQSDKVNLLIPRYGDRGGVEGVEYVDTSGAGAELLLRLQEHMEEHIERFIIGQTLSSGTEGNGLGGTGVAAMHADTKAKIVGYDANNLSETLTTDWLDTVKRWTYPEAKDIPVRWKFDLLAPNPDQILDAVEKASGIGAHFKEDEVVALTGLSVPREGDKVIGGKVKTDSPFGAIGKDDESGDEGDGNPFGDKDKDSVGNPAKFARRAEVLRYEAGGHWITIGARPGPDGKRHGGTPIFVKDGRVAKGHPNLVGRKITALHEPATDRTHRQDLHTEKGYKRAVWGKKARKEGLNPKDVHQLAAEFMAHDKEHKSDITKMLAEVRKAHPHLKSLTASAGRGRTDASMVKGLDDVAKDISEQGEYKHLFHGQDPEEHLFHLLSHGNPEPMSEDEAYETAFDHLMEHKHSSKPDDDDDEVPFARTGDPVRYGAREELLQRISEAVRGTDHNPSDAQKDAGNYGKGKFNLHGLGISIENPKGAVRSGTSRDGKSWSVEMKSHYGYIRKTESEADGDHIDVFIGDHPESEVVFVIDQVKLSGAFDEHKCMLGFTNAKEAKEAYLANYSPGWKGLGGITAMTIEQFKDWIFDGDTSKPLK